MGDIEATRQQFLERSLQESRQALEREHAEMDEAVKKLKEMEMNGSILSMLDDVEAKSPVAWACWSGLRLGCRPSSR